MRPLTKALQTALMWLIDLCARTYVHLNPHPMKLTVTTEERIPRPAAEAPDYTPEPDTLPQGSDLVYAQWLDEIFENSPSEDTRFG